MSTAWKNKARGGMGHLQEGLLKSNAETAYFAIQ
jgi:hypothetical protein